MIRRPMLWAAAAFASGCAAGYFRTVWMLPAAVFVLSALLLRWGKRVPWARNGRRQLVWFLILLGGLSLLGTVRIRTVQKPCLLEEKLEKSNLLVVGAGTIDGIERTSYGTVYYLRDCALQPEKTADRYSCKKVFLYGPPGEDRASMAIGNKVFISGKASVFSKPVNPGQFNEWIYYKSRGFDLKIEAEECRILDDGINYYRMGLEQGKQLFSSVFEQVLEPESTGLAKAMLLGDKSSLDKEVKELYEENGISHILAISGFHVSMLGLALYRLLNKIIRHPLTRTVLTCFVILSYGYMTNFSVSTSRAVVMFLIMLFGTLIGRSYDLLSAAALSALLILIRSPLQLFQSGFLLSFGAILAIGGVYPGWKAAWIYQKPQTGELKRNDILQAAGARLKEGMILSLSIQLVTLPVMLWFYSALPLYGPFLNLFILPAAGVLITCLLLACGTGIILLPLGRVFAWGAEAIFVIFKLVCRLCRRLPFHYIVTGRPSFFRILLYTGFCLIGLALMGKKLSLLNRYRKKKIPVRLIPVLFLCCTVILVLPKYTQQAEILMMDVSQGDCFLLKLPGGTCGLIDGGSSDIKNVAENRIKPCLKAEGIRKLDWIFVSHTDQDHINGILGLLEQPEDWLKIRYLVLPACAEEPEQYETLKSAAKENGVQVGYLLQGAALSLSEECRLICLHPEKDCLGTKPNEMSMVLRLEYKDFSMLFTGDLEGKGERELLESGLLTPCTVLKTAHHGSARSSPAEFLELTRPEAVLISCGRHNRYGHPHAKLLERLRDISCSYAVTAECGAVSVRTNGRSAQFHCFLQD
ncbi:DNA internalization-related competence protein ComEC/Rec2 [Anaerolentibacter hominis]|uniref:DNA internalization-related competence protein ComEC/Rec2 n=1 Tax=Anaerolentibacter hominis TaxID=3079009 RepID=UPI0031B80E45